MKTKILILVLAVFAFGACMVDNVESIETIKESVVDDALKGASNNDDGTEKGEIRGYCDGMLLDVYYSHSLNTESEIEHVRNEYLVQFSYGQNDWISDYMGNPSDIYHDKWFIRSRLSVRPLEDVLNTLEDDDRVGP